MPDAMAHQAPTWEIVVIFAGCVGIRASAH